MGFPAVESGRLLSKQAEFKMAIWAHRPHMPTVKPGDLVELGYNYVYYI